MDSFYVIAVYKDNKPAGTPDDCFAVMDECGVVLCVTITTRA